MVSDGRSQLQEESLAWASRRVGGAPGTSERSRPHKGPAPEWTQHSRLRGEACSQASEQQPCLMNTGFALNKSPLILRAASKEVPPSPATHSTHVKHDDLCPFALIFPHLFSPRGSQSRREGEKKRRKLEPSNELITEKKPC